MKRAKTPERRAEIEEQLRGADMPLEGAYLWDAFWRLRRRRGGNGFAMSPITWPDIAAFVALTRFPLAPWEVEVIEAIDDHFLKGLTKAT